MPKTCCICYTNSLRNLSWFTVTLQSIYPLFCFFCFCYDTKDPGWCHLNKLNFFMHISAWRIWYCNTFHCKVVFFFFFFFPKKVTTTRFKKKRMHPAYVDALAPAGDIVSPLQTIATSVSLLGTAHLLHKIKNGPCHAPSWESQVVNI